MGLVLVILQLLAFGAGLYKLFEKAGVKGWHAMVPGLNLYQMNKIAGRDNWRLATLLIPIWNIFTFANMLIDFVNSFGRWTFWQQAAAVFIPYIYFPLIGFKPSGEAALVTQGGSRRQVANMLEATDLTYCNYIGPAFKVEKDKRPHKGVVREWAEAITFAVFAASFIRMFMFEMYVIPTPSMEGTMLVGDYLLVSKMHYGSRLPSRPLSVPILHNLIPYVGWESYLNWPDWGYHRMPGISPLKRYDPCVFNFPEDDTIIRGADFNNQYHNLINSAPNPEYARKQLLATQDIVCRPFDKRDNYVKRCVGMPGDNVEVRDRQLYVNGEKVEDFPYVQHNYLVYAKSPLAGDFLTDITITNNSNYKEGILRGTVSDSVINAVKTNSLVYIAKLNRNKVEEMRKLAAVDKIEPLIMPKGTMVGAMFPYNKRRYPWNKDQYGPIHIPAAGETVTLTPDNIDLYRRIIVAYEHNTFEQKGDQYYINGQATNTYTIKMNYYWMMGDNRHDSADSRFWGFVAEDAIVGKPLFIWFSRSQPDPLSGNSPSRIRWERLFTGVDKQ